MTHPEYDPTAAEAGEAEAETAETREAESGAAAGDEHHQPPHPPFARSPEEYTDPPGHHRRGPNGPALDVGA